MFHPEHFICAHCGKQIANESFHLDSGKPYCAQDYKELFCVKCCSCKQVIGGGDRWLEALDKPWHADCFRCAVSRFFMLGLCVLARLFFGQLNFLLIFTLFFLKCCRPVCYKMTLTVFLHHVVLFCLLHVTFAYQASFATCETLMSSDCSLLCRCHSLLRPF